jgi:hypothetical protein
VVRRYLCAIWLSVWLQSSTPKSHHSLSLPLCLALQPDKNLHVGLVMLIDLVGLIILEPNDSTMWDISVFLYTHTHTHTHTHCLSVSYCYSVIHKTTLLLPFLIDHSTNHLHTNKLTYTYIKLHRHTFPHTPTHTYKYILTHIFSDTVNQFHTLVNSPNLTTRDHIDSIHLFRNRCTSRIRGSVHTEWIIVIAAESR